MERTLLTDFRNYMVGNSTLESALGVAPLAGTNVFISFMPDSPDECIVIYPSGGSESPTSAADRQVHSVYVLIRAVDNNAAYKTGIALIGLLDDNMRQNSSILQYSKGIALVQQSQPVYVGRDDNLRSIYRVDVDFKIVKYTGMTTG